MWLILPLPYVGYEQSWKIKQHDLFFNYKSGVVALSIYIRTVFYFKIEINKKERQGNKKIILW